MLESRVPFRRSCSRPKTTSAATPRRSRDASAVSRNATPSAPHRQASAPPLNDERTAMNEEPSVTHWHGSRRWTPAEATASLPLVRRISDDLRSSYRRWRQAVEAFEYATAGSSVTSPSAEADRLM